MTAIIKKSNNGYGETVYNVIITQNYNNGFEIVERFVQLKSFSTEKRAQLFKKTTRFLIMAQSLKNNRLDNRGGSRSNSGAKPKGNILYQRRFSPELIEKMDAYLKELKK